MQLQTERLSLTLDDASGEITSLTVCGKERLVGRVPLFRVSVMGPTGERTRFSSRDAAHVEAKKNQLVFRGFSRDGIEKTALSVFVGVKTTEETVEWSLRVQPDASDAVEWVDAPLTLLPTLSEQDPANGGRVLFPFNEGALVSDATLRARTSLGHLDPDYPPRGSYATFPNMVCSQFLAYLFGDAGLYVAAHDPHRAVKGVDFIPEENGILLRLRLFGGGNFGEVFAPDYPVVWAATGRRWESAAERYRAWFSSVLPPRVCKIAQNKRLPEWYADAPLVVSYPVRGAFDMDRMDLNDAFFPYVNALPTIRRLREATGRRILVLLMHWEGTAPWAPPYVWPPLGGEEAFFAFRDALHRDGNLLGVYCSGFSYTMKSNLVSYSREREFGERGIAAGVNQSPEGKIGISMICQGQRSAYDLCPVSPVGRAVVEEAYRPLFEKGIDYIQILDQNHGGSQYFCYARDHGHPPVVGRWTTEAMQTMLGEWNDRPGAAVFGCESAAAEPFLGNLPFSDNRFELNYRFGRPVPLYAYCYHEYLRNFMGNQCGTPFDDAIDTFRHRLAYSFAAGDCPTLVLDPSGNVLSRWGNKDLSKRPDNEKVLRFVANLTAFERGPAGPFLARGRMIPGEEIGCATVTYPKRYEGEPAATLPALHTSAWENEKGERVQIVVNPEDREMTFRLGGKTGKVAPLNAVLIPLDGKND